ncbi:MAG: hypothetical protein Q8J98_11940 [Phaeovulum sp.]|uniref:hypothetical protein n=1 Tax=Phaeovulum sp. TaxID=2934796 RepID=UPI00272F601A|nr:hypothetical protein [Phaeovulum sp.]MDP2063799.1 hypothetical protein [Phaeovulum sp.]
MQARYLGDSHDFLKYALLRQLHTEFGGPVGLNWYLTDPEKVDPPARKDGEKRHHLHQPVWRACDPKLLDGLHAFQDPAHRRIADFETSGIMPTDTLFISEEVPTDPSERAKWHGRALARLSRCSVIFLDPDNGFEVKSMTPKRRPKYALFDEVRDYEELGAIVVTIQFARQCSPETRAAAIETERRKRRLVDVPALPALRGRVAPNLLFFLGAPSQHHIRLIGALGELCNRLRSSNREPNKLEWLVDR